MLRGRCLFVVGVAWGCVLGQLSAQSDLRISGVAQLVALKLKKSALGGRLDELTPILDLHSHALYFTRGYDARNVGGASDPGDIWRVDLRSSLRPRPLLRPLNSESLSQLIGFAEEGKLMYLFQEHPSASEGTERSVAVARRTSAGWEAPKPISIPYFWNKSRHQSACVSSEGDLLIVAVESFGSHGNEDLYVTHRDASGRWSPLENLGSDLNTPYQERGPYLLPDRRSLVFATNGREGYGSWDLYLSHRIGDGWTEWSEPENLGTSVNSTGAETFFSTDLRAEGSFTGYFVSTQSSEGYADLWTIEGEWSKAAASEATQLEEASTSKLLRPILHIKALDERNKRALEAGTRLVLRATYHDLDTILVLGANGAVDLALLPLELYSFELIPTGFLPLAHTLKTPSLGSIHLELNFAAVQKGSSFLGKVYFVQGTDEFLEDPHDQLQKVVDLLRENPNIALLIAGHTDNQGNADANLALSKKRAEAVRAYLVSEGVEPKRLKDKGYGATRPIASNRNKKERAKNRRVEFIVR